MTTINRIKSAALLFIAAGISIFSIGCSETSPNGPGKTPMDQITVSLTQLSVTYDCDNNISFTDDAKGDFEYSMTVAVQNENGNWETVKAFSATSVGLDNGESKNITDRNVTFELPRESGQRFRVYTWVGEKDSGSNYDFSSSNYNVHEYDDGQSQLWAPVTTSYNSYSATSMIGNVNRSIWERDQTKTLGIVTTEGCACSISYAVQIKHLD